MVARAELVREAGGFRDDLYALGDWDLWLKLVAREARGVPLPDLLVAYTVHPANMHLHAPQRMVDDFHRFDAIHGVGPAAEERLWAWMAEDLAAAGRPAAAAAMHLRRARARRHPGDLLRAARAGVGRGGGETSTPDLAPFGWLEAYRTPGAPS